MIKVFLRVTLLVFAFAAFAASHAQQSGQASVYEALFAQVESLGFDRTYYVREREGRPPSAIQSTVPFPSERQVHARANFGRIRVLFVDESFLSGLWDSGCQKGWAKFHERYPQAGDLTQVSRVLLNESGDQASVYVEQGSGCQSSCGATYQLALQADVWAVVGRTGSWCS
jgi:hypothetical protein